MRASSLKLTKLLTILLLTILAWGLFGVALADEPIYSCPVVVNWDDQNNAYGFRTYLKISVYYKGTDTLVATSTELSSNNGYKGTVSLKLRNPNNLEYYEYEARVTATNGIHFAYADEITFDRITKTWTVNMKWREKAPLTVRVKFNDYDNLLNTRPDSLTPTLVFASTAGGGEYVHQGTPVLEQLEDKNWVITWDDVQTTFPAFDGNEETSSYRDAYYHVRLLLNDENYTDPTNVITGRPTATITASPKLTSEKYIISATVSLRNDMYNNSYLSEEYKGFPEQVRVHLLDSNGTPVPGTERMVSIADTTGYSTSGKVSYAFDDAQEAAGYTLALAEELPCIWGEPRLTQSTGTGYKNLTLTSNAQCSRIYVYVNIDDNANSLKLRGSFYVYITSPVNREQSMYVSLGNTSGYNYTSGYYPTYDLDGEPVTYTYRAKGIPGCYLLEEHSNPNNLGWTYNYTLPTRTVTAAVEWEGEKDNGASRPQLLTLDLMQDGTRFLSTNISETDNWQCNWEVPQLNSQGEPAEYTVEQNDLQIYTTRSSFTTEDANDPVTEADKPETALDDTIHYVFANRMQEYWNYSIELEWDTNIASERFDRYEIDRGSTDVRTLVYRLTINVNAAKYKAGDLEVHLPYSHVMSNTYDPTKSEPVPPTQIAVPKAPEFNPNNAFNYYVDDMGTPDDGSDDELVFVNWRDIEDSLSQTIEVQYKFYPYLMVDTQVYEWQAVGHGKKFEIVDGETVFTEDEVKESAIITYGIDTGHEPKSWSLSVSGSYDSEWLNEMIYRNWYEPDKYAYRLVTYNSGSTSRMNQHSTINVTFDVPDGAEIFSSYKDSLHTGSVYGGGFRFFPMGDDLTQVTATHRLSANNNSGSSIWGLCGGITVMMRFPIEDKDTYTGVIQAHAEIISDNVHENDKVEPYDYNDLSQDADEVTFTWVKPQEYDYTGEIYSSSKGGGDMASYPVTRLQLGMDVSITSYYVTCTYNGYKDEYCPFQIDMKDDAIFAQAEIDGQLTEGVRLTDDDYVMTPTGMYVYWNDRDDDGIINTDNKPQGEFILMGRKTIDGEWEEISRYSMDGARENTSGDMKYSYFSLESDKLKNNSYVAFRVLSPEGLEGKVQLRVYFNVKLFATSEKLQKFVSDGMTKLYIHNWCAVKFFVENEDGEYVWLNPYDYPYYDGVDSDQLHPTDLAEHDGKYLRRHTVVDYGGALDPETSIEKTIYSEVNNTVDSTVEVRFKLYAEEDLGSNAGFFTEKMKEMAWQYGVFYDLLPLGFKYDPTKELQVSGCSSRFSVHVEKVETIDNYKDTGRQMVRFYIEYDGEPGTHYYSSYTSFTLYFTAKATWEQLSLFPYGYNVVGFHEGSLDETTGEVVYGGETNVLPKSREDNGGLFTNTHGVGVKQAMTDLNGDGITSGITDTLMDYVYINPDFVSAYQVGLGKVVKANSGVWQTHDVADLGGEYRYKINFTVGSGGSTKDLVLFDILEEAANTEGADDEVFWKGKFRGVDTSIPELQGVAPKVYYSTVQNLNYNEFTSKDDLADTTIWSLTPPENLDMVTAVAFDLTKSVTGSNYTFGSATTTEVEIIMEAPELLPREKLAYNRPSYSATTRTSTAAQWNAEHHIGHRVTVALYDEKDLVFTKLGEVEEADPMPLSGVEFTLYKCTHTHAYNCLPNCHTHNGIPGEEEACWETVIGTETSAEDGSVAFADLTNGMYALIETGGRDGYIQLEDMYWTFEVDASTVGGITAPVNAGAAENHVSLTENNDGALTLLNTRKLTSIEVEKQWAGEDADTSIRPDSITLDLYRNEELYREGITVTPDGDGNWSYTFEDLYVADFEGNAYTYEVRERPVPGYTASTSEANGSVTITNTALGQLEISKLVVGGNEKRAFTFTVSFSGEGTPLEGDYTVRRTAADGSVSDETVTAGADGSLTVTAAHGESVRLLGLPIGASYTVVETAASGYTPAVTAGSATGTIQTGTVHQVTYTNTYDAEGEWTPEAAKNVNGEPAKTDETFTFTLTSGAGTPAVSQEKTNNGGTILFDPISYGLSDAGKTYTYTVCEAGEDGGGYTLDDTVYTVTVTVSDNDDGTLTAKAAYTADGQSVDSIVFNNTYEATGEWNPIATKTVNGTAAREDQVFSFQLLGAENKVLQTVENNGSSIAFDPISYTLEDLAASPFTYRVQECEVSAAGYTGDDTIYTVFVWLEDNRDGTLKTTTLINNGEGTVDAITFDNTYQATGQLPLTALKTVNGGAPREDQVYAFTLTSGAGTPTVSQEKNNQLGSIVFDPLQYTYADAGKTYTYYLRESTASEGNLAADPTVYTITVNITDNGDGTLSVEKEITSGEGEAEETVETMAFNNMVYAPLTILKTVDGPETDETFPFTIRLYNADGSEATGTYAYTGSQQGSLQSGDVVRLGHEESITIMDLLPGMTYSVEEDPGIRYTGTVGGQAQTTVAGSCVEGGSSVEFVNVLKTTGISVIKEWQGSVGGDIQLVLHANGVKVDPQPVYHQEGQTYSFINLPLYDAQGQTITYSVKEKYMDGYLTIYQNIAPHASETECVYNGGTIINREVVTFRIRKVWSGLGELPKPRIELTLYCNGEKYDRKQPEPDADGWYVYRNLPKYVNGERANYTIKETAMSGFDTYYYAIDGSHVQIGSNGGKIVNVMIPATGDRQPIGLWAALSVLAGAGMAALLVWKRKRQASR